MAFAALGDGTRAWELFTLINPINHVAVGGDRGAYKVEPYVVAADVYATSQHVGRGGWTWYTGSAGWMYRLLTESLLGLRLEVDRLRFEPSCRRTGSHSRSTTATARRTTASSLLNCRRLAVRRPTR